jgi:inorganic triphosphatase YgiF
VEAVTPPDTLGHGNRDGEPRSGRDKAPPSGGSHLEIELKLAGTANALETLWNSAIAPRTTPTTRRLISTYFDTPDLRLRRRGFSLRIRQDGDDFVQTVKAGKNEARSVTRRREWSTPIDGSVPDLMRLDDPEVRQSIGLVITGELQPVFTTEVVRQTKRYRVRQDGREKAHIEAALDRGEIRCGGKRDAICELELELLEGSPVALQKEAARLLDGAALEYQPLSKAERGFALACGERPAGRKAGPPKLNPEGSVDEGLECILASCVNHWLANHAAVLDGADPEGVHQIRVAFRRLRSALTIFKSALPANDREWLQREAKSLIAGLGSARDWDVFIDDMLQPVVSARPEDDSLKALRDAVNDERRRAYEQARAMLRSPQYLKLVLDLGAWLDGRAWRTHSQNGLDGALIDLADEVLSKRHKQVIKLGRRFDDLSDEALHRLRISLKKLRYTTEFFTALYAEGGTEAYVKSMRQLQDDLGHLNDLAVAEVRLADLRSRIGSDEAGALQWPCGVVIGWHTHALAQIRPRIAKDWRDFTRIRPFWQHGPVRV